MTRDVKLRHQPEGDRGAELELPVRLKVHCSRVSLSSLSLSNILFSESVCPTHYGPQVSKQRRRLLELRLPSSNPCHSCTAPCHRTPAACSPGRRATAAAAAPAGRRRAGLLPSKKKKQTVILKSFGFPRASRGQSSWF